MEKKIILNCGRMCHTERQQFFHIPTYSFLFMNILERKQKLSPLLRCHTICREISDWNQMSYWCLKKTHALGWGIQFESHLLAAGWGRNLTKNNRDKANDTETTLHDGENNADRVGFHSICNSTMSRKLLDCSSHQLLYCQ